MSQKTISIAYRGESLKRWDIFVVGGTRDEGIVIFDPVVRSGHSCVTVYPYKRKKTKLGKWLWFKWLKLRIWLKIIRP